MTLFPMHIICSEKEPVTQKPAQPHGNGLCIPQPRLLVPSSLRPATSSASRGGGTDIGLKFPSTPYMMGQQDGRVESSSAGCPIKQTVRCKGVGFDCFATSRASLYPCISIGRSLCYSMLWCDGAPLKRCGLVHDTLKRTRLGA